MKRQKEKTIPSWFIVYLSKPKKRTFGISSATLNVEKSETSELFETKEVERAKVSLTLSFIHLNLLKKL